MSEQIQNTALARIDHAFSKVEDLSNWVASIVIFILMLMAVYQVIARRLDFPIFGYIDMIEQMMVVFAFAAVAYCQREGGHVRMELFVSKLRGRTYWIVELIGVLIAFMVISILIVNSFDHFLRAWQLGDSTINAELPIWPSKLLIPVAFSLLWIRLLIHIAGYYRMVIKPEGTPVAVTVITNVQQEAAREIREALGVEVEFNKEGSNDATR